jgi:hypothetical protein
MRDYKPGENTATFKVIAVLKSHPAGTKLGTRELTTLAGVPFENFAKKMSFAVQSGALACESIHARRMVWSLGTGKPSPSVPVGWRSKPSMCEAREPDNQRQIQQHFYAPPQLVGKLRDLFNSGRDAVIGDPLQLLNDALDAAKAVDTAKDYPGCRFKAAEVDLLIARELRAISETAVRARANLLQALEIMA